MRVRVAVIGVVSALALCLAVPASAARLSSAERKQISRTIDVFVNHAVKRQDVGAAYDAVTPAMRGGMTRRQWAHGAIPVYSYPARGKLHAWSVDYITPGEIGLELMLQPARGSKLGAIAFHVYLHPVHGRWLVDEIMPAATFAPAGQKPSVTAASDFGPAGRSEGSNQAGPGHINPDYAVLPLAVFGVFALGFLGWLLVQAIRDRPKRTALPPLSIPGDDARARTGNRP